MPSAPSAPRVPSSFRLTGLLVVLIVVAVAWTGREIPSFEYALLMDDDTNILFNAHLGVLDGARLWWMFTDMSFVSRYMPLSWLSFNCLVGAGDLSPWPFHIAGVIFHGLNALIVFSCLRLLIRRFQPTSEACDQALAAGMGALLWSLHPLRVEAVAWCSGLIYVEGGCFTLLSLYARLRELEARHTGVGRANGWFALSALMFAFSLLTYPVALFLPAVFLLLDYSWCKSDGRRVWRALWFGLIVLGLMAGAALGATLVGRSHLNASGVAPISLDQFGVVARLLQAGYVWTAYLWRTIWPLDLKPIMDAIFEVRLQDVRIWAPFPVLIILSAAAWRFRRRAPFVGVCWLAYLVWMVPVLGLTEHPHVPADRYSYLSGLLLSIVVSFGLSRVPARFRSSVRMAGAVVLAGFAVLSVRQARYWRDPVTMFEYVFQKLNDEDLRNITLARIAKLRFLAGEVREGRALGDKVYRAAPHIAGVARTWREMQPAQSLSPEVAARPRQEWRTAPWVFLHDSIAAENLREGRRRDALVRLDMALAMDPDYVDARFRRALVRVDLGDAPGAAHDWLVLTATDTSGILSAEGMRFLSTQISAEFRAQGDVRLADGLSARARQEPPPARAAGARE
ncbi:MAG: hypothetical protein ABIZ81_00980 [Opitutaceae bacterium]